MRHGFGTSRRLRVPADGDAGRADDEMIDVINGNGAGVIGTPEQAREQVQRIWDQSGGFGCLLHMGTSGPIRRRPNAAPSCSPPK